MNRSRRNNLQNHLKQMKFSCKVLKIGLLFVLFLALSCQSGLNNRNNTLTLAAIPSDDMTETLNYVENFSKYLARELNVPVHFIKATDYTAVIEAMKSHKVDIAMLGPFSYVMASARAGAEALVTLGTSEGNAHAYKSILVTHRNSGIGRLSDIKARAPELILSFTDPASTSGHLIPRTVLKEQGINPDTDFKNVVFSGSHAASILTTISGKTDIAFANNLSWNRVASIQNIDLADLQVIWESEPIYPDPVCVPKTMDDKLKKRIQQALIDLRVKDTMAWNQFISYDHAGDPLRDSLRYIIIHDSAYNPLRKMARALNTFNLN